MASSTPSSLHPLLCALGIVGVVPNLRSLSFSRSNAQNYPTVTPPLLVPGAWPHLQFLSTHAAGLFSDVADARDVYASLFLACGSELRSLDFTAGGWGIRVSPVALTHLLAVIGDEVSRHK